ncbi:hypothetical protein [Sabulicella glaciei]|uniref:Uncharacterized protein n=1 Tax=Sabulicella glaciei TaxID=2984948 RepID=A0ABT3P1I4_9PROT|nr:hypothetical protein [Roseococcus sp. MDT2-1-1]MCW8088251.1 hypothetical protein [Roseococcus sp. MDT2-1-1]
MAVGALLSGQGPQPGRSGDAAVARHFRLTAATLACFVQHREIYKAATGEPVFLLANRCPPQRPPSLLDALTNEGPNIRLADPTALDQLVTLNRAQLACLDRLSVAASDAVVVFFPDDCRVEPAPAPR